MLLRWLSTSKLGAAEELNVCVGIVKFGAKQVDKSQISTVKR